MSLADEIRNEIENIKELKITVGDINNHLSVLEGLTRKDIEEREKEAYQRGCDDGYEAGCATAFKPVSDAEYQRGLDDAWGATKRIFGYEIDGGIPINRIREAFGIAENAIFCTADIIRDYTAREVVDKIKAYENKQKDRIEVGDEVICDVLNSPAIVTNVSNAGIYVLWKDGSGGWKRAEQFHKTGKHHNIEPILEGIRNES